MLNDGRPGFKPHADGTDFSYSPPRDESLGMTLAEPSN
jgi:hypothetical protein